MATTKTSTKKSTPRKKAPTKKAPTKKAPAKKAPTRTKSPKQTKSASDESAKRLSAIDAASKVLGESKQAMTCREMIETMVAKKLWESPNGKTPDRTLCSAILREMNTRGKDARFKKTEHGKFAANG